MVAIGIAGIGNWGQNIIRVVDELDSVEMCCHTGADDHAEWLTTNYPHIHLTTEYDRLVAESDAIFIATPTPTHYTLAKRALDAGCHVFVEKPMTTDIDEATELATTAASTGQILFCGYIFVHHPIFRTVCGIHDDDPITYAKFEWHKTGSFDSHIIPNLASHDLAMAYDLFGGQPQVMTVGDSVFTHDETNIISIDAKFAESTRCRIDIDRLAPTAQKRATFITESDEIYHWADDQLHQLHGDTYEQTDQTDDEPLTIECRRFLNTIRHGEDPITDGHFALAVTQMMERFNYPGRTGLGLSDL